MSRVRAEVERYDALARKLEDARAIDELLSEDQDAELAAELPKSLKSLKHDVERLELATLLGGEYDKNDAVASLHAGAGGTES